MKTLSGIFLCLLITGIVAAAQQRGEANRTSPHASTGGQPSGDVLVRALLAADKAEASQERSSAEPLKKRIEREIAKSASLPLVLPAVDPFVQGVGLEGVIATTPQDPLVVIDGAVYFTFGDTIYPMTGGGASGCFDPTPSAKLQQARLKYAEQKKAESKKN